MHRAGNYATGADKEQRYFVVIGEDIWYTSNVAKIDKLRWEDSIMKRVLVGGFISLIGSIWALAIFLLAANNMTYGWSTPPGRILTTISELNMTFFFVFSIVFVILGLVLMLIEYFRKDE